ncbi:uncharacterized protein [Rutidosis leptorrhynchoides]|uniref:uncharacterized protein n=1 Tax=Rutidosis leptorrhynchoides TaxID=125765 RepID=UPI003A98F456
MGFREKWKKWMGSCFRSASISVLVNGSPTLEFHLKRGIRQGDQLSPYLFIIASEGLNLLTNIAIRDGLLRGVDIGKNQVNVSHLQFADDTIFFGKWGRKNIKNILKTLTCFENSSGLKVNMSKSSLYGIGVSFNNVEKVANEIGCSASKLPFIYLGMPIGQNMSRKDAWDLVVEKIKKRLSDWKARTFILMDEVYWGWEGYRFWEDSWVNNARLKEEFSRLYRLDSNREAKVIDHVSYNNGSWVFTWNWSRELTGRLHGELLNLENKISSSASLGFGVCSWSFKPSGKDSYVSRSISKEIDDRYLVGNSFSFETLWNKLVPQKIGIFIWRVLRSRIPVRLELEKRGVELDSTMCPICDSIPETVNHAIVDYTHAKDIWEGIFKWWGATLPRDATIANSFLGSSINGLSSIYKEIWQVIELVTGYQIWKN